jgi:hypothetical protein
MGKDATKKQVQLACGVRGRSLRDLVTEQCLFATLNPPFVLKPQGGSEMHLHITQDFFLH